MAAPSLRPKVPWAFSAIALVLVLPVFLGLPTTAQSESLGVSPAEVRVVEAQEGQSYERRVTVQNAMDSPTVFTLGLRGDIAPWATTSPVQVLEVPARTDGSVTLRFEVPDDAYIGTHKGQLAITADPRDQPEGSGLATAWGVTVLLNITVGGEGVQELTWSDPRVPDVETGTPPTAIVDVVNSGNMLTTATILAEALAYDDDEVLASAQGQLSVIPGQQETLEVPFEDALPEGQYRMRFTATEPTEYEALTEFKVVPPGALGKEGLLRFIEHEPWVQTGELVRLAALFENSGTAAIAQAVFTAEVRKDGRLVEVIESDPRVVRVGERIELVAYFTPEEPGEHIVTGQVGYDGYRTQESESVLNVQGGGPAGQSWLLVIPLVLLVGVIITGVLVHRRARSPPRGPGRRPTGPRDPPTSRGAYGAPATRTRRTDQGAHTAPTARTRHTTRTPRSTTLNRRR